MLADQVDYVVGVDTHRDEHVLAVVVASTGAVVAQRSVATRLADTVRRVGSPLSTPAVGVCGRSREQATTVPGSPVISAVAAKGCSRRAAARATSGGCTARTTASTRSALPARRSPATSSRHRKQGNARKRFGSYCSPVAVRSTFEGWRSCSCAA